MNDILPEEVKLTLPMAVAALMVQVVASNEHLEEAELQRTVTAIQEVLDISESDAADLISDAQEP
ncbi:MAG TPA: hypothetical protein DHU16_02335, partial [Gammaproteobacteria bacterium]|nr:hypothetical protein [Gammaproteobacteria bacterium]